MARSLDFLFGVPLELQTFFTPCVHPHCLQASFYGVRNFNVPELWVSTFGARSCGVELEKGTCGPYVRWSLQPVLGSC